MRKKIAAAAACMAVGGAFAQSSVVMFGVVDAAVTYTTGSGPAFGSKWQLANSSNSFSRLGFRGTEDLGGGLTAGFWLESGLMNDTGTGYPSNSNNQLSGTGSGGGLAFSRRSTVSLVGAFGEVRLGRDYTPTFWSTALFDPFGTGSGIGANQIYFTALGGLSSPTGTRASNSVGYFLPPDLGGFYGQLMVARGENASDAVLPGPIPLSTASDGNYSGGRIGWSNGPFNVVLSTGVTSYAAAGNLRVSNLGISYTFERWMGLKLMSELYAESQNHTDGKGALVGFILPVGVGDIKASYAWYRREPFGGSLDPTTSKIALGYVYNFSKRTAVYTTVAHISNSNGAAQALAGATTSPNHGSNGTEFGLRTVF